MLNFDFLDKGLGIVSVANFVYDFSTKMFLILCSINSEKLVPDRFLFLRKALYQVKASGMLLDFTISIALKVAYNRKKLFKTLKY